MSRSATNWAFDQRGLKPAAKIVLLNLADFHTDAHGCFPSQAMLADRCEMSRASINRHLDELEEMGRLRREQRIDDRTGRQTSTRYLFAFEAGFTVSQNETRSVSQSETPPLSQSETPPVSNCDTNLRDLNLRKNELAREATPSLFSGQKDPEKETGKKAPRAARLPADWTLPDEWASWAVSQGLDHAKVRMEGERFRDYWTAAPGSKGVKADWLATWRNWCRSCMERMGLKPPAPDAKPADYSERIVTNLAAYYGAKAALSGRQMLDQEFRNKLDVAQQLAAGMDEAAKQALVVEAKRRAGVA